MTFPDGCKQGLKRLLLDAGSIMEPNYNGNNVAILW